MKTIEVFLFIGLFLMVGYAFIRARKEVLKAKRVEEQVINVEAVVSELKSKILELEKKAASGYSDAENQLSYYKAQLKKIEEVKTQLNPTESNTQQ